MKPRIKKNGNLWECTGNGYGNGWSIEEAYSNYTKGTECYDIAPMINWKGLARLNSLPSNRKMKGVII